MKSRTYTVNRPTRTFTYPLSYREAQALPWYRKLLRFLGLR